MDLIPFLQGKNVQIGCKNCQKDITRSIMIFCQECNLALPDSDPNKNLIRFCIDCFSAGVEIEGHVNSHSYRVSDCLAYPIISKDWNADEELLLLEGIEMYGLGNWKTIAEHVNTKSDKKCEQHYMQMYLSSKTSPLPEVMLENGGDGDAAKEEGGEDWAALPKKEQLPGCNLAGYMPLRGDFDVEYDNDAELILADMEFLEDDHPTERELKLRMIDIYNAKLDERERRKKFAIERGLLDYQQHIQLEKKRTKEERDLVASIRPFARFHSAEEHDELVGGLLAAMKLRKRIAQLQEYRKNGIRTLEEGEEYEREKAKRESKSSTKRPRDSSFNGSQSSRGSTNNTRERSTRWSGRNADEVDSDVATNGVHHEEYAMDISNAPGCELLTAQEQNLCSSIRLLPKHYMVIKDALIRESFRLGYLEKGTANQMLKIDVQKSGQIYDFLVHCGWVSNVEKVSPSSAIEETPSTTQDSTDLIPLAIETSAETSAPMAIEQVNDAST